MLLRLRDTPRLFSNEGFTDLPARGICQTQNQSEFGRISNQHGGYTFTMHRASSNIDNVSFSNVYLQPGTNFVSADMEQKRLFYIEDGSFGTFYFHLLFALWDYTICFM